MNKRENQWSYIQINLFVKILNYQWNMIQFAILLYNRWFFFPRIQSLSQFIFALFSSIQLFNILLHYVKVLKVDLTQKKLYARRKQANYLVTSLIFPGDDVIIYLFMFLPSYLGVTYVLIYIHIKLLCSSHKTYKQKSVIIREKKSERHGALNVISFGVEEYWCVKELSVLFPNASYSISVP